MFLLSEGLHMYSGTLVHKFNLFYDLGKKGHVCVCVYAGRWLHSCWSPNAEFADKNKILTNASIWEPNCLQTKAFQNQDTIRKKEPTSLDSCQTPCVS